MKYFDKLKNKKAWAAFAAQAIKIRDWVKSPAVCCEVSDLSYNKTCTAGGSRHIPDNAPGESPEDNEALRSALRG
ncbi:hypothetical protein, partial [Lacrimispora sp.]|uniref:hypothetical protein n=1 Tax=Lacrimispora sp. TaxID=2719234 RepID=UPI0028A79335